MKSTALTIHGSKHERKGLKIINTNIHTQTFSCSLTGMTILYSKHDHRKTFRKTAVRQSQMRKDLYSPCYRVFLFVFVSGPHRRENKINEDNSYELGYTRATEG